MILSGFEAHQKKYIARRQIEAFIYEEVKAEAEIEEFYYIGRNEPKDIVLTLTSINHKRNIYRCVENIKHLRNSYGRRISFRDYWTQNQSGFNKKSQQIADIVALDDTVDQKPVTTTKTDIFVGDIKYIPKISPPEATSVLRYPLSKLNEIMAIHSRQRKDV